MHKNSRQNSKSKLKTQREYRGTESCPIFPLLLSFGNKHSVFRLNLLRCHEGVTFAKTGSRLRHTKSQDSKLSHKTGRIPNTSVTEWKSTELQVFKNDSRKKRRTTVRLASLKNAPYLCGWRRCRRRFLHFFRFADLSAIGFLCRLPFCCRSFVGLAFCRIDFMAYQSCGFPLSSKYQKMPSSVPAGFFTRKKATFAFTLSGSAFCMSFGSLIVFPDAV